MIRQVKIIKTEKACNDFLNKLHPNYVIGLQIINPSREKIWFVVNYIKELKDPKLTKYLDENKKGA